MVTPPPRREDPEGLVVEEVEGAAAPGLLVTCTRYGIETQALDNVKYLTPYR